MADEIVNLKIAVPNEFFDEFDRRFEAMARRATQAFNQAGRGMTPGGAGAAGQLPGGASSIAGGGSGSPLGGGGVPGGLGTVGGFAAQAGMAFLQGAGQGIRSTPAASASSPSVLAQNAAVSGVGNLLESTVGKVPILGDLVMAQFNSVKEAMEVPTERGVARLKSVYGNFAAAGIETTREERQQAIAFTQAIERRRYEGERMLEREYREVAARDSVSYGLSFIGR